MFADRADGIRTVAYSVLDSSNFVDLYLDLVYFSSFYLKQIFIIALLSSHLDTMIPQV